MDSEASFHCNGFVAPLVMASVVMAVIAATDMRHPFGIPPIPLHSLADSLLETLDGLPADLIRNLVATQCIAPVVSRPILHVLDHRLLLACECQQQVEYVEIGAWRPGPDVMNLTDAAAAQHGVERPAMILDVNPIVLLLAITIHTGRRFDSIALVIISGMNFSGNWKGP